MNHKNLVHRDLKPQNILIEDSEPIEVKIADFGFATFFKDGEKQSFKLGTPIYMAPEVVQNTLYD